MVERELHLAKTPESNLQQTPTFAERLVNTYFGRTHINEAIAVLRDGNFSYNIEGVVDVAQIIASAGISPAPTLEVLQPLRDGKRDNGHGGRAASWGMAKVYALMGDYEAVERSVAESIFPTDIYFFAARTQMSKGEDPTKMLQAAEATTREYNVKDPNTSYAHQVEDFERMGSIYAQAGLDDEARRTFSEAEAIVDRARGQYNEAYNRAIERGNHRNAKKAGLDASDLISHDSSYHGLALTFADIGWFEDALRVADNLKEDKSHYFSHVIEIIVDHQLQHGLADDAVETAGKLGDPTYVKTLAKKAVIDAQQGKPHEKTVQAVVRIIEGEEYDEEYASFANTRLSSNDYVEVRATLGVATAKAGDLDATKIHFDKAWEVVQQEDDPLFKPSLVINVAKAVDDAGFDASRLFGRAIDASEAIPDNEDIHNIKWSTWAEAITESADRGYLDLARNGLSRYCRTDGMYYRSKAKLLAQLGATEIRSGLSYDELQALSQGDMQ